MFAAFLGILAIFQSAAPAATTSAAPQQSPQPTSLRPIPFWQVRLEDDFWAPRIRTTIEKTIPACFDQCEKTGRIANWERAAKKEGKFEGYFFNDSDVYKVIEAAAYALKLDPNATYKGRKLDEYLDELIAKIAAMQQPDGYVNSYFVLTGEPKWTDIEHKHELYCAGHLIEAAVAHYECTGKLNLLNVAGRLVGCIGMTFGPDRKMDPCGHPEIELALLRWENLFYRRGKEIDEARKARYPGLEEYHWEPGRFYGKDAIYPTLPAFFLDQRGESRGRQRRWGEYAQDHKPLAQQTEIVGHAVRAMYLLSAATDYTIQTRDPKYLPALDSLWRDLTERKMYITGGIGSSASNEGFTTAYDLPNETAYAETCASIGLMFWAHRMNLLHADGRYFDVLERALYNNVLAAISLDGTQFNYVNPLASRGQHRRQPWHACACCPPNLARLFPTVGGYMYAQSDKAIYVNMYAKSTATFQHGDATVTIKQETRYPWDGEVDFSVSVDKPCEFALYFRSPEWTREILVSIGGQPVANPVVDRGYLQLTGRWQGETVLSIELSLPIETVHCNRRVKANVGRTAIQRGPIVYCVENVDNLGEARRLFVKGESLRPRQNVSELADATTLIGVSEFPNLDRIGERLYWTPQPSFHGFNAVPYYAWNNREAGDMLVWIPESPAFLDPQPVAWLKPSASHCWKLDTLAALHDRQEPSNSSDAGIPRFTWWPKKGGELKTSAEQKSSPEQKSSDEHKTSDEQWVQYDFDKPRTVSAVEVYWFDDSKQGGGCKPPAEWRLQSKVGEEWLNVSRGLAYGVETDRFNRVSFDPVDTTGLRIVAKLADGFSAGILEWKVE